MRIWYNSLVARATKRLYRSGTGHKRGGEELAAFEAAWDGYYESRQGMWREACDKETLYKEYYRRLIARHKIGGPIERRKRSD